MPGLQVSFNDRDNSLFFFTFNLFVPLVDLSLSIFFLLFYSSNPCETQLLRLWLSHLTDVWQDSVLAVLVQVRSTQHVANTLKARPVLLFALKLFNLQDMVLIDDGGRAWPACCGGGGDRLNWGLAGI